MPCTLDGLVDGSDRWLDREGEGGGCCLAFVVLDACMMHNPAHLWLGATGCAACRVAERCRPSLLGRWHASPKSISLAWPLGSLLKASPGWSCTVSSALSSLSCASASGAARCELVEVWT
eukprot:358582-Chlamydomonas_euryale.AAC.15